MPYIEHLGRWSSPSPDIWKLFRWSCRKRFGNRNSVGCGDCRFVVVIIFVVCCCCCCCCSSFSSSCSCPCSCSCSCSWWSTNIVEETWPEESLSWRFVSWSTGSSKRILPFRPIKENWVKLDTPQWPCNHLSGEQQKTWLFGSQAPLSVVTCYWLGFEIAHHRILLINQPV